MKQQLDGKDAVLMQDGWSDIQNHPVIATSPYEDSKTYFLSAIETIKNKKTAQYCTDLAEEAISQANEDYGCNVVGIVTDKKRKCRL